MNSLEEKLLNTIRDVQDFPKPGIVFKDITPVLKDAQLCEAIVSMLHLEIASKGIKVDAIAGAESRGFFFGFLLANKLRVPFIPIRKPGKLPFKTVSIEYDLEYGSSKIEMNEDAIEPGWNVIIHDDLLATGGTAAATAELIKRQGGIIAGFYFMVGLGFLNGAEKLKPYSENIFSLANYSAKKPEFISVPHKIFTDEMRNEFKLIEIPFKSFEEFFNKHADGRKQGEGIDSRYLGYANDITVFWKYEEEYPFAYVYPKAIKIDGNFNAKEGYFFYLRDIK